ncbi:hypothetical protein, partial [Conyzicola sp.]|uniref:hypothetical protein n=1 Tax=Conyzicola sp. TaxID=1969404 RepID=UPI003988EE7D
SSEIQDTAAFACGDPARTRAIRPPSRRDFLSSQKAVADVAAPVTRTPAPIRKLRTSRRQQTGDERVLAHPVARTDRDS